jgi:geranylgeranyl reductase family protein
MNTPPDLLYDLIIVGGGPSGSAAVLYARQAGLSCLLLDRATFPRDKICGDALSGKSVTALKELGLIDGVRDLPGATIHRVIFGSPDAVEVDIDLRNATREEYTTGFVIRRQIFDAFLWREACQAATAYQENVTVKDLLMENGTVTGVSGEHDGHQVRYRGRIVLGADGFNSIVSRKAGLYRHEPRHWIVALRQYYENVSGLTDQIELQYVDEVLPGYFWIFPLENGSANVGIGMVHKDVKEKGIDLKEALRSAVESPRFRDRFAGAKPTEEPVGWNLPVGSKHRKNHGSGFMLLGDAASLIDPFTGEGIGNALYSAKFAVETAREAVDAGDVSEKRLSTYDRKLWDEIGDELRTSARLQSLGRFRPLLNFVLHKAARSTHVRDVICGMIANEVPKRRLTNPLFYLRLLFS